MHYLIADPVRVVDEQGEAVAADGQSLGEVLVRGYASLRASSRSRANEGSTCRRLIITPVLARRYIELRDRNKGTIVSTGENILTIEVENAVSEHPAVAAVAVVSMPDGKGESGRRPSSR